MVSIDSLVVKLDDVYIDEEAEVTEATCVADVAGSLGGRHWLLNSPSTSYYVWYDVDGGSADPAPGGTGIEVDISANDSPVDVASATQAAIQAVNDFATSVANNVVTISNRTTGSVTNASDVDSGTTFSITTEGVTGVTIFQINIDTAIESTVSEFMLTVDNFDYDNDGTGDAEGFFTLFADVKIYHKTEAGVETLVFRGRVEEISSRKRDHDSAEEILVAGRSYASILIDAVVLPAEIHVGATRSSVITSISDNFSQGQITTGGVTATTDSITRTIQGIYAWDAMLEIADDINYSLYVDKDNVLQFKQRAITPSGDTIAFGTDSIVKWDFPDAGKGVINKVTVYGGDDPGGNQIISQSNNFASQVSYGSVANPVVKERIVFDDTITTDAEAVERSQSILSNFSFVRKQGQILLVEESGVTSYSLIEEGQTVTLSMDQVGVSGNFLVLRKKIQKFPFLVTLDVTEFVVGTEDIIAQTIKELRKFRSSVQGSSVTSRLVQVSALIDVTATLSVESRTESSARYGSAVCGTDQYGDRSSAWSVIV